MRPWRRSPFCYRTSQPSHTPFCTRDLLLCWLVVAAATLYTHIHTYMYTSSRLCAFFNLPAVQNKCTGLLINKQTLLHFLRAFFQHTQLCVFSCYILLAESLVSSRGWSASFLVYSRSKG